MLDIRPLTEELQIVARKELNEKPERLHEDIRALKEWVQKQEYLRARTNDQFLLSFLRGCKFSLEKAKSKIDKYYTLKSKYPEFFSIRDPDDPKVVELLRLGVGVALPRPLHDNGPRIMLIRPGCYSADRFSFDDIICIGHAVQEIQMLEDDYANVHGVIEILDLANATSAHMLQMTPTTMKKMTTFAEEAVPIRQKATHFINTPIGFGPVYRMMKPFMPLKQQARLYIHGSKLSDLYKYIPQEYLPEEYGGSNGSIAALIETAVAKFQEYRDYYIEERQYGVDEKLRPFDKKVDYDKIFGINGTFRRLNID